MTSLTGEVAPACLQRLPDALLFTKRAMARRGYRDPRPGFQGAWHWGGGSAGLQRGPYLPAGDVILDEVGMLQAQVLDREPILEMAHHSAGGLANGDVGANSWPLFGGNGTTRLRNVDNAHGNGVAVGECQSARGVAGWHTAVAAVIDGAQQFTVGEPGQLGGELVTLAGGGRNGHGKAILKLPRDHAFKPAYVVHIGNNP